MVGRLCRCGSEPTAATPPSKMAQSVSCRHPQKAATMRTPRFLRSLWAASVWGLAPIAAQAGIEVHFGDPAGLYVSQYADIQRVAAAAGQDWMSHFLLPASASAAAPTISVQINFAPIATATGRSTVASQVGTTALGLRLFEQGAAYEMATGIDPNGDGYDVEITVGSNGYLQHELWFDPSPLLRQDAVPQDRTDAYSVFLHEFGHAFGFNGWRDGLTGALEGDYLSTFDALVDEQLASETGHLSFGGVHAVGLYGAPVPLTQGLYGHLGNWGPLAGAELQPDLMNGLYFVRGSRYEISALDLAVLRDLGLPITPDAAATAVSEPGSLLLALLALAMLLTARHWAKVSS